MAFNLNDYLYSVKKEYPFRLKFAVHIDDDTVNQIEEILSKYQLSSISSIRKTIMQSHPMDFANIPPSEVYILDVVLEYPVTDHELHAHLTGLLGIPRSHLVVRNPNHPDDEEIEETNETEPSSLLGSDYEDEDIERPYGPTDFLTYLDSVRQPKDDFATWSKDEIEFDPNEFLNSKGETKSPIHGDNIK